MYAAQWSKNRMDGEDKGEDGEREDAVMMAHIRHKLSQERHVQDAMASSILEIEYIVVGPMP
jgi:hypothetical protein